MNQKHKEIMQELVNNVIAIVEETKGKQTDIRIISYLDNIISDIREAEVEFYKSLE